jgi:hypothetical protein
VFAVHPMKEATAIRIAAPTVDELSVTHAVRGAIWDPSGIKHPILGRSDVTFWILGPI